MVSGSSMQSVPKGVLWGYSDGAQTYGLSGAAFRASVGALCHLPFSPGGL